MSDLATTAIGWAADVLRRTPADELPIRGRLWTLTVTDDDIVVRIARASRRVNGTPQPREEPNPNPPPAQPKPEVHPKPPKKPKEDQ